MPSALACGMPVLRNHGMIRGTGGSGARRSFGAAVLQGENYSRLSGLVVAVGVVIAVARTGIRALVPVLVGCISMFDYDYFLSGLIRVISIVPAIATVAGAESHCRYHYHQGRGGSVDVHSLLPWESLSWIATTPQIEELAYRIWT
jgi:hypothetical protein